MKDRNGVYLKYLKLKAISSSKFQASKRTQKEAVAS